nr:hypothetical protein CFP56_08550 [Quercus suber]
MRSRLIGPYHHIGFYFSRTRTLLHNVGKGLMTSQGPPIAPPPVPLLVRSQELAINTARSSFMTLTSTSVWSIRPKIESPIPMMPYDRDARNEGDTILRGVKGTPLVIYGIDGQVEEEIDEPPQPIDPDDAQI